MIETVHMTLMCYTTLFVTQLISLSVIVSIVRSLIASRAIFSLILLLASICSTSISHDGAANLQLSMGAKSQQSVLISTTQPNAY